MDLHELESLDLRCVAVRRYPWMRRGRIVGVDLPSPVVNALIFSIRITLGAHKIRAERNRSMGGVYYFCRWKAQNGHFLGSKQPTNRDASYIFPPGCFTPVMVHETTI